MSPVLVRVSYRIEYVCMDFRQHARTFAAVGDSLLDGAPGLVVVGVVVMDDEQVRRVVLPGGGGGDALERLLPSGVLVDKLWRTRR
jgi:hypothetical protein